MTIKVRDFEVRLTRNKDERRQVRQLRYEVFVEEEGAAATEEQRALREEYDSYDRFAEYMAVFHNGRIVGTYRSFAFLFLFLLLLQPLRLLLRIREVRILCIGRYILQPISFLLPKERIVR